MVSETLEHMVPILVEFTANIGNQKQLRFLVGEFGNTAKKWTLPVPTPTACSL